MKQQRLSVAVANIKQRPVMSSAKVLDDLELVRALRANVTGLVEIGNARYKNLVKHSFDGQIAYNLHTENPCVTALPVATSWYKKLVDGVAGVTPGRYNAAIRLNTTIPVLVIVKHPVSRGHAYASGHPPKGTIRYHLRRQLLRTDTRLTGARIRLANRRGRTVVVLADSNDPHETAYTAGQVVAAHRGLMWITVHLAPGVTVRLGKQAYLDPIEHGGTLNTDHPALYRALRFTLV